ncbi:MAG TPA: alpha/beta hydrolase [Roseimicrobium sp.]|nr:alpha/beta hydrolase [Roseimicrobium sp.]
MHSRREFLRSGLVFSTGIGFGLAESFAVSPATERLDRNKLLTYRDASGAVRPVKSVRDWERRRTEIVAGMESVMGVFPGKGNRCPLDMKVEEDVDMGSYVRRLITYSADTSSRTPAYLLMPKEALLGKKRVRAVLCLHPTDNVNGHKVVVGLGGKANRQYAQELAERGFVTLAPAYPLLANFQPDLKIGGYESGTMKAIWDNVRGLDLLETLPFVKKGGFGVIGHSLGGHNSLYTAVFEPRLKVVVSSCGLDSFLDYYDGNPKVWEPGKGWTQERYMPRLASYAGRLAEIPFDFHELIGALAPRPCFINAPLKDGNFRWQSVDRIVEAARPVYRLYGRADRLAVEHPDSEHDFPDAMRERAYELMKRYL